MHNANKQVHNSEADDKMIEYNFILPMKNERTKNKRKSIRRKNRVFSVLYGAPECGHTFIEYQTKLVQLIINREND